MDEAQILRFSGPGPRYTSYPTVPAWSDAVGEDEARAAAVGRRQMLAQGGGAAEVDLANRPDDPRLAGGDDAGHEARENQVAHGVDSQQPQGIELLRHIHCSQLGSQRTADAASEADDICRLAVEMGHPPSTYCLEDVVLDSLAESVDKEVRQVTVHFDTDRAAVRRANGTR